MSQSSRRQFERRAGAGVVYLGSLPRWMPFVGVIALLLLAVFEGNALGGLVGFLSLGALAVLLAALAYASWPRLTPPARVLRVVSAAVVAALAISFLV